MRRSLVLACTLTAAVVAPLTWAQNLALNSSFDTNVDGWFIESVATVAWSVEDADGSPSSGSALVTNVHPSASQGAGIAQCIPVQVVPNVAYSYGGRLMVPSGQGNTGNGQLGLRWYAGVDCSGLVVGDQPRLSTALEGPWVTVDSSPQVAPAGAHSVRLLAFVTKYEAGGSRVVYADNLYLVNTDVLFADSFEGGDLDAWSRTVP